MVLEQRHEDSRTRERGIVERVREPHLAVGARYRMFARRACQSCRVEQLCVSRYLPRLGTQLSMSFMRYLPSPMSPVEVSIT
jgi:hypothetical protein